MLYLEISSRGARLRLQVIRRQDLLEENDVHKAGQISRWSANRKEGECPAVPL